MLRLDQNICKNLDLVIVVLVPLLYICMLVDLLRVKFIFWNQRKLSFESCYNDQNMTYVKHSTHFV